MFECEEGVELEYPTQEELQQLAHQAAQAAVRAQYEQQGLEAEAAAAEGVRQTARKVPAEEVEPSADEDVEDAVEEAEDESA